MNDVENSVTSQKIIFVTIIFSCTDNLILLFITLTDHEYQCPIH